VQVLEPVAVPTPPASHDASCPFCKEPAVKGDKSKIGEDNDAKELEDSLAGAGEPRAKVGFAHPDYGAYSPEPHHLVSGNEALKGHPIERWLATKASGTYVKADSGFNVNDARNGVWLPSIPDANRVCSWVTKTVRIKGKLKKRRFPSPDDAGKERWSALTAREKDLISFAVMLKAQLQFHKGNHRNKGAKPSQCYIKEVKRLLNELNAFAKGSLRVKCPEAKRDEKGKYPPPRGLNELIYSCASAHLRWHVSGVPESWFVFISKLARRLHQEAVDEGKTPWEIPYPGHPDRA